MLFIIKLIAKLINSSEIQASTLESNTITTSGGLVGEVAEEGGEVGVGGNAHFFA